MREPRQHRYPTDLSDAEWAALEPLLPPLASKGRPLKGPWRLMVEAVFYLVRSGCAWRMLPSSFPPRPTVFGYFRRWRLEGTRRRMHDRLRALAREAEGRHAEPSAAIIDSQTVRATGVGGPARGYDAAKRTAGRKRHILVDAAGLILLAHVHAADLHDRLGAKALIAQASAGAFHRLELVWADGAYAGLSRALAGRRCRPAGLHGLRSGPSRRDMAQRHSQRRRRRDPSPPLHLRRGVGALMVQARRNSIWIPLASLQASCRSLLNTRY